MKLSVKAFALTSGILWGAAVCLATLWLLLRGNDGTLIRQIDHFYLGYSFSYPGAFVGLVWGFVRGRRRGALRLALQQARGLRSPAHRRRPQSSSRTATFRYRW